MKKGDIVLIKASAGQPGVRRIWDPAPDRPFVCYEEYWARWERNQHPPVCWPVSRDQVFAMDESLVDQLEQASRAARKGDAHAAAHLSELWRKAKQYR